MSVENVIWDLEDDPDGNIVHCGMHDVTQEEVEDVLANPTDTDVSRTSGRPVAFGETRTGRHLIVVYELIDDDTAYPITAYEVARRK